MISSHNCVYSWMALQKLHTVLSVSLWRFMKKIVNILEILRKDFMTSYCAG